MEETLERLRKLQSMCIRLREDKLIEASKFFIEFRKFVSLLPQAYKYKGYSDTTSKELTVDALTSVWKYHNGIYAGSFEECKAEISKILVKLYKDLTS